MNRWCASLAFLVFLSGCYQHKPEENILSGPLSDNILYAKGFTMERRENQWRITVSDPWQNAKLTNYSYILSDTAAVSRFMGGRESVIRTPVRRVVCLSTTHIGFIDCLGKIETVIGISGRDYVVNQRLRYGIEQKSVSDVGYDENINYELVLKLKPDVVFAYGVTASVTKTVSKLQELEIPVVLVAEYLEEHPLAKLEWIKFFAAFFGVESKADSIFNACEKQYNYLTELAAGVSYRPEVIMGLPWRGIWYISGGQSYAAQLISDAGGDYAWKQMDYKDSRPVELESIYENALMADYWLNAGDACSKAEIAATDERFRNLKAFKENTIYNNNRLLGPVGGNAYFESGVVEPHIILADLISIFHPQLLPSHELVYYQKLE